MAKEEKRPEIPPLTKMELWANAAGRCEFDGCNEKLSFDGLTMRKMNSSNIAHIIAWTPTGPRGDFEKSPLLAKDITNLMLMCRKHHTLIDSEQHLDVYTVEYLQKMKKKHEDRIDTVTAIAPDKKSHILVYSANIGKHKVKVVKNINPSKKYNEIASAMLPDFYPSEKPIELGISGSEDFDDTPEYWDLQTKNLKAQFNKYVKPYLENGDISHLSIFAFGTQPLLILLGSLITEKYPAQVYQLNRKNSNWKWQNKKENAEYIIEKPNVIKGNIPVLSVGLSASIDENRIKRVISNSDIWTFTAKNASPEIIKSKKDLYSFNCKMRMLLDEIKGNYPIGTELCVFPIMPVSTCVELGRLLLPKADMKLKLYDHDNNTGFTYKFTIGGEV